MPEENKGMENFLTPPVNDTFNVENPEEKDDGGDLDEEKKDEKPEDKKDEKPEDKSAEALAAVSDKIDAIAGDVRKQDDKIDALNQSIAEPEVKPEEKKEGFVPKSWDDMPEMAKEKAEEVYNAKEAEKVEAQKKAKDAEVTDQKNINAFIDDELKFIEDNSILADVTDPNDPEDVGVLERKELFGLALKMKTNALRDVAVQIKTLHEQGVKYDFRTQKYTRFKADASGKFAPVGSSNKKVTQDASKKPTYSEIQSKTMDQLADEFMAG